MCIICTEYMKERMNVRDIIQATQELYYTTNDEEELKHLIELMNAAVEDLIKEEENNGNTYMD